METTNRINKIPSWITDEPVAILNGLIGLIEALLALAAGFGWFGPNWTPEQLGLVMAVVIAIGNFVKTLMTRARVTPVDNPHNHQGQRLVPET